jgi:hypothetical protein
MKRHLGSIHEVRRNIYRSYHALLAIVSLSVSSTLNSPHLITEKKKEPVSDFI